MCGCTRTRSGKLAARPTAQVPPAVATDVHGTLTKIAFAVVISQGDLQVRSTGHLQIPERYSALSPRRALDGRTMMLWRPQIVSFGVFAILASAVLITAS